MKKRQFILFFLLISVNLLMMAQTPQDTLLEGLNYYLGGYQDPDVKTEKIAVDSIKVDDENHKLDVYVSLRLAYIPMRPYNVQQLYRDFKDIIPNEYQDYKLTILSGERAIEQLIPNYFNIVKDPLRLFQKLEYKGNPWTQNLSRPFTPTKGLNNRHIALWQSHGIYHDVRRKEWRWQRPRLYGTTEDQFTQSIVLPFLIPMLENAGAIVYTPRERDIQTNEVVVDNDGMQFSRSEYKEIESGKSSWMRSDSLGFAQKKRNYNHGENPFKTGTAVYTFTEREANASVQWIPDIPATGNYAVYVSYQTTPRSVSDAHYKIIHSGTVTEIQVNQQMGGGTWVYLGTYHSPKDATSKTWWSSATKVVRTALSPLTVYVLAEAWATCSGEAHSVACLAISKELATGHNGQACTTASTLLMRARTITTMISTFVPKPSTTSLEALSSTLMR